MSLTTWLENRWLIDHESSPQEVTNLPTPTVRPPR